MKKKKFLTVVTLHYWGPIVVAWGTSTHEALPRAGLWRHLPTWPFPNACSTTCKPYDVVSAQPCVVVPNEAARVTHNNGTVHHSFNNWAYFCEKNKKKNNFTYKLCNINLYEIQHRGSTKESHRRVFDFIHIYSSDCLGHQNFNKLWGNPKCNVPPATRVLKARIPSE